MKWVVFSLSVSYWGCERIQRIQWDSKEESCRVLAPYLYWAFHVHCRADSRAANRALTFKTAHLSARARVGRVNTSTCVKRKNTLLVEEKQKLLIIQPCGLLKMKQFVWFNFKTITIKNNLSYIVYSVVRSMTWNIRCFHIQQTWKAPLIDKHVLRNTHSCTRWMWLLYVWDWLSMPGS